jgi:2-polyprenyl-3-methyl-5-hydroxy-6-metoxy-1,4-benzoquinol methylase
MRKLTQLNVNTSKFWDTQYAPQRRATYIEKNTKYLKYDRVIEELHDGEKILDMGCGLGIMATKIKETYPSCDVWAFDYSESVIDYLNAGKQDIHFQEAEVGKEEVPNDFDVAICLDVVEHLTDASIVFTDAHKHLKTGGRLIVNTPDGDTKPYAASPEHMWLFTHEDIDKFYTDNGFSAPEYLYLPGKEGVLFLTAVGEKL